MLGARPARKLIQVKAGPGTGGPNGRMKAWLLLAAALLLAGCASGPARPEMALRGIMRDMGREAAALADALMREDYARVESAALKVAEHPQPPPEERARIITWLGPRAVRFRGYDQDVHKHAQAAAAAAQQRDARAALAAFHEAQSACMGCHLEFRSGYLKQFYGL
jgi:cytochrome c556